MTTITTLHHARAALIGNQFVLDPSVHKLQLGSNAQAIAAIDAEIARLEARKPEGWPRGVNVNPRPDYPRPPAPPGPRSSKQNRLTREQAAIIGAFTGISCGPFSDVHATIERVLGRPVLTHEMANEELWKDVRERMKPEFLAICAQGAGETA